MGPSPIWRVPPDSVFRWREWDGEHVVYHDNSGDTHRLNALGAAVLRSLIGEPGSTGKLAERVRQQLPPAAVQPDLELALADLLIRFRELGLVESIPSINS